MFGELLYITQNQEKAARQILEYIKREGRVKYVIAIAGDSGTGKSGIAHTLSRFLKQEGTPAKVLHIDNFYKVPPTQRSSWRRQRGVESIGLSEYDWDCINGAIDDFREGRESALPFIDLRTDQVDTLITDFDGLPYLIIEGLYTLEADADLKVFIELSYRETISAQVLRGKETLDEFRIQVLEQEHKVVLSLRPEADLIVTREFSVVPAPGGRLAPAGAQASQT
jgi:uridine kinase